jgi:hypothetical protein
MRNFIIFLSILLIPSYSFAFRVIEHSSRNFVLLDDHVVPGTNHKASELLDYNTVPNEVHTLELIREAGDTFINATWKLNTFYFAQAEVSHEHAHECRHHDYGHQQCSERQEFCWTDYEQRCGYEWEYRCHYYNGKRICRYEQVYRCYRYPVRRCIWQDVPITYYERHSHSGELPHFNYQISIPVKVIFPANAPLSGNRTERFTVEFDGETPTIRFENIAYFYTVDRIEEGDATYFIFLRATNYDEIADPENVSLTLGDSGVQWSWVVADDAYGLSNVASSYHLKVENCFLVICDKQIDHYAIAPFEIFSSPLRGNAVWSVVLDVERRSKFFNTPIKISHRYEYRDGELKRKN